MPSHTRPSSPDSPASPDAPPRHRSRFVAACQQLLVLGVICAGLTPAARMVSIELGPADPDRSAAPGAGAAASAAPVRFAAYAAAQTRASLVPTAEVDPTVREVPLTAPTGARVAPGSLATAKTKVSPTSGETRLVSTPQKVTGYGAVGVTWEHGAAVADDEITVKVRTRDERGWSSWLAMDYHDEHGPDPDSAEGRDARPGTDELLVGEVADVQVKVISDRATPADLSLAVIDPGVATSSQKELPAIDTGADTEAEPTGPAEPAGAALPSSQGDLELSAGAVTPKPVVYSRAQWGANERLRDPGSLHYYEVHAGFVHHTVNANDYRARDVPAILRGIYAYHTQSRGWSDIGYNYLVDRFGRIWEGRYGGVDRPVVGAHTLGYNDDAFAASAIGNFEEVQPSRAMVQAYGALFGWKLSLHGIDASSTKQYVTSRTFQAVNGHRDAGSTACPGRYLYAKVPEIRKLAAQAQVGFSGRQLESQLVGSAQPDLVVRRTSDRRAVIVPLRKQADRSIVAGQPVLTNVDLGDANLFLNAGDWDRDGRSDLITRRASDGALSWHPGLGRGRFGPAKPLGTGFGSVGLLSAVGDMTGDGWPDLMGQPRGGSMRIYPGLGARGLGASYVAYSGVDATRQIPVGLWGRDGAPDSMFRSGATLRIMHGNGPGGLTGSPQAMRLDLRPFDLVTGVSDVDLSWHPDLVVRKRQTGELYLIRGYRKGFGKPQLLGTGFGGYDRIG